VGVRPGAGLPAKATVVS